MYVLYACVCVKERENMYVYIYISLEGYVRHQYTICFWGGELGHWGQGGSEMYFSLCILVFFLNLYHVFGLSIQNNNFLKNKYINAKF